MTEILAAYNIAQKRRNVRVLGADARLRGCECLCCTVCMEQFSQISE